MDDHFLFYAAPDQFVGNQIRFPDDEARHISRVLRKRPGDNIQVTDGTGSLLTVRLLDVGKSEVNGEVIDRKLTPEEPERILALGVIRHRDRLEFAVEKAVELGATRLFLVHSDHAENVSVKAARIDKIIISAMKQSRRTHLTQWEECESFSEIISVHRGKSTIVMAHADGTDRNKWMRTKAEGEPMDNVEKGILTTSYSEPMLLMVGPEGGFSDAEVEQAKASGAVLVSLGPVRLRAETAVCALLALVI